MPTSLTTVSRSSVPSALLRLPAIGPALVSLERQFSAPESTPLGDTLVRVFLAELIDERAKELASLAGRSAADVRPLIHGPYLKRLIEEIDRAAHELDPRATERADGTALSARLDALHLRDATLDDFRSTERFSRLVARSRIDLSWRGGVARAPVSARERTLVGAILLRAVQAVALDVVELDYPTPSRASEVPAGVGQALSTLHERLAVGASQIGASAALIPLPLAQARIRWSIARAEDRVWLPLRAIPTAPLADSDLATHYAGRSDDDARRLGHQIRRADGAILVSGYRGVGKSTFVNRVIYHALHDQARTGESNGKIVVPVTINLAKVAGVNNVLRLTLRGLRSALLDTAGEPLIIPGDEHRRRLPIRPQEREQLEWAYVRSTWKVAFTRARSEEQSWDVGTSVGFDPGKLAGWELGKLFSAGARRSRSQKVNRELSLLDYDENAAEEDVQELIRRLAEPRALGVGGPSVGIKLVFIFDELDKMDQEKGVLPLIEGLKNLFLQQHCVFMLVTSKQLYYNLLKDRVKEDATLTSYFSSLVHIPLLHFAQVRALLDDWIDSSIGPAPLARTDRESRLLDQLARYLTYRSLGNPREIIRELREMQHWGSSNGPSYLTDALAESPQLAIFSAIQQCVELVARPSTTAAPTTTAAAGVALASDRLSGDEARLEQVRRGLYVLVEELLDRQMLALEPARLDPIRDSNFTLLSTAEVQQLAQRLGDQLATVHQNLPAETFAPLGLTSAIPLFKKETQGTSAGSSVVIRTCNEFYALSGRQAMLSADAQPTQTAPRSETELLEAAEAYAAKKDSWAEWLAALGIMRQIDPAKWTPPLQALLLTVLQETDPQKRLAAVELLQLRPELVFSDPKLDLEKLFRTESEERIRANLVSIVGAAGSPDDRRRATNAILELMRRDV